ncbi:MAG TPA: hypothetical protein P5524_01670 [Candidatus Paceibacterota bacterium]|nr:hypothetical protein [Candidatus Paceibacterota bacterium]
MKKFIYPFLIASVLATNVISGLILPVHAQSVFDDMPQSGDLSGVVEAAPESFIVPTNTAEFLECSTGISDFITSGIQRLIRIIRNPACQAIGRSALGTTIVSGECTIDTGGATTDQMCREWVQKKQAELQKYLAQVKKLLIATYVRRLVDKMAFDVVDWIGGKTTGTPQFVTNWQDFIWGTAKESIGDVIETTGKLSFLCAPFRAQVVLQLPVPQRPPLPICTLDTIMTNIENFYDDFRSGSWLTFNEVVKPQNNPYGAWIMQMESLDFEEARIKEEQELKAQSGYIPTEQCIEKTVDPKTGEEKCLDTKISIPGQAKSDLTSKALAAQMDKAESYMITEADLSNYAEMIGDALLSRLVKSAKTAVFGGKEYGEGLLDLPETGTVVSDRYSCERSGIVAMCVSNPNGTMTKGQCDSTCQTDQTERYRCDRSGSTPACVKDSSGTMTRTQCAAMCAASMTLRYSCMDIDDSAMCAIDPNGQYASVKSCEENCAGLRSESTIVP